VIFGLVILLLVLLVVVGVQVDHPVVIGILLALAAIILACFN
jgi:hypothetical protein